MGHCAHAVKVRVLLYLLLVRLTVLLLWLLLGRLCMWGYVSMHACYTHNHYSTYAYALAHIYMYVCMRLRAARPDARPAARHGATAAAARSRGMGGWPGTLVFVVAVLVRIACERRWHAVTGGGLTS